MNVNANVSWKFKPLLQLQRFTILDNFDDRLRSFLFEDGLRTLRKHPFIEFMKTVNNRERSDTLDGRTHSCYKHDQSPVAIAKSQSCFKNDRTTNQFQKKL